MQVKFLPGTHYLATAGRDRELKLWDCDSYELITSLQGHQTEILALAMSQDAAFIVTAGTDRQIRFWKRSQEQLFLSEERSKELEEKFEQEVEREDVQAAPGGGAQVIAPRPSRRTIESVRTTERLMEILNATNIYEVLLCLPFSHAHRLLKFICEFLEAVASIPDKGGVSPEAQGLCGDKVLSAAATLETPCQAALITAYVHHSELASTTDARLLLLRLRKRMRSLLQAEKDRIGFSMAGIAHLQRTLKRASALREEPSNSAAPRSGVNGGTTTPGPAKKKRKR
jgi:U3 small nucleolar RNA-associated protein 12